MILKGSIDNKIVKYPLSAANKTVKNLPTFSIVGGEFAITDDNYGIALQTLLGSCVAVMFYDKISKIKAINHFLLPQNNSKEESYRFGLYSIEEMLNAMYKLGARKENLCAKIAGGARVLDGDLSDIGMKNVLFARDFCQTEKIEVISESVLGNNGRMVLLGSNFDTFIRFIENRNQNAKIKENDTRLNQSLHKTQHSNITLF